MSFFGKAGAWAAMVIALSGAAQAAQTHCARTVSASVVALDQAMMINRLGASRPGGMIYALRSDIVTKDGSTNFVPGNVQLRLDKRPRPIVLRANVGDCLTIEFENLLQDPATDPLQPVTRYASVHVAGMQLVKSIADDGTFAGANPKLKNGNESGLVPPRSSTSKGRATYHLYAAEEGSFLLYSTAGDYNGFGTEQLTMGLFGAVNIQPKGAEWYRSQVSEEDMRLATRSMTREGYPVINYDALYPPGHRYAGQPILKMLDSRNRIVHSDLTAIVTGPGHGRFPGVKPVNPALPDPGSPYREITVHYHESQDVVQAFPWFYDPSKSTIPTINAGADSFAINYGAAGIAAEILANRFGLGPGRDCVECKFEEFFLSSWVGGDPAMVVDVPANVPCTPAMLEKLAVDPPPAGSPPVCTPTTGPKASKAFFPDDPSNVYHTYQGDRARFRILHAGASVHHVHHHHAHQWLHSPGSDQSSYLDSQAIGPGSSFTLDLVYDGSGNRNLTAGDSIFHCHFYPHFASGMWALFRVHDVLETGTPLDASGRPRGGTRALPDGEIVAGTPIPGVVPLPTRAMAPLPAKVSIENGQPKIAGKGNPGYPFFVPGVAGHRPPHPPMDFAVEGKEVLDGGLPRHLILGGAVTNEQHTTTDFSKDLGLMTAYELPEMGTPAEKAAMAAHAQKSIWTARPDGTPAYFKMTGLPPAPGAPFANPGAGDQGNFRRYKGANLQVNAVFNKKGWHYPQQRMMALWEDVKPILGGEKPPEPLFFRANSNDVVEYWHTNLVPAYYELDDFQVRTPTDIIGQHIHLVKFDVLASDGAANGFNYEDGSFSPEEVRNRIAGINQGGGLWSFDRRNQRQLAPKAIPSLGSGPTPGSQQWVGAQATVQRWWVDPLLDRSKNDRTYMTVFTHDHFAPSTHQMIGLYGGLLVEPTGSKWTMPDGSPLNTRSDGGPTSYAANILPPDAQKSYREFALAWGDLQLVYGPGSRVKPDCYPGQTPALNDCTPLLPGAAYQGWADPANAINCPTCNPAGTKPAHAPAPYLISDFGAGMLSMNYRTEPLPLRVAGAPGSEATDLSHAFRSIPRLDPQLNTQPAPGSPIQPGCTGDCFKYPIQPIALGMLPEDPYTPLLRAYENDPTQIRLLAGAHTSMHDFTLHGIKWLFEPFNQNSGYRNSQFVVLSEHFEALFRMPRTNAAKTADYLYNPSASYEGLTNGLWGILRSHKEAAPGLAALPSNPTPPAAPVKTAVPDGLPSDCKKAAPCVREFKVSALTIAQLLGPGRTLVYNSRGAYVAPGQFDAAHPLYDPNAIVYVHDEDLDPKTGLLKAGLAPEPLVLRVAAGDWIRVRLSNRLSGKEPVFGVGESAAKPAGTAPYTNPYAAVTLYASSSVGLHPQLVAYDISAANGVNIGINPVQTVAPTDPKCADSAFPCRDYVWYAGTLEHKSDGSVKATPVEFGAINLQPSDPLVHAYRGLFGALVVEPLGSTWVEDAGSRASATVFGADGKAFRDFTLMAQDDVSLQLNGNSLYASGNPLSAFNYRSEPFFYRYGKRIDPGLQAPLPNWANLSAADLSNINNLQFSSIDTRKSVSNSLVGGDPQTPIFRAPAGMPVRFRLLDPAGIGDNQQVFELTGHVWQEEPFVKGSTKIGFNPASQYTGTTPGYGPTSHFDIVIPQAGGKFKVPGDYLYRSWTSNQFQVGLWGLFRVAPAGSGSSFPDTVAIESVASATGGYTMSGITTVRPTTQPSGRVFAPSVSISADGRRLGTASVDRGGRWSYAGSGPVPASLRVVSPFGGVAEYRAPGVLAAEPALASARPKRQATRIGSKKNIGTAE